MPQVCKTCNYHRRAEVDAALLANVTPLTKIADAHRLGVSSVARHRDHHLTEASVMTPLIEGKTYLGDLLSAYMDAVRDAAAVREMAVASRRPDLILKSSRETRDGLAFILGHLNIGSADVVDELHDGTELAKAIGMTIAEVPAVGAVLADALTKLGHRDAAGQIEDFTKTAQLRLEQKAATT